MSMFDDIDQKSDFAAHESSSCIAALALAESPQVHYYMYLGKEFS